MNLTPSLSLLFQLPTFVTVCDNIEFQITRIKVNCKSFAKISNSEFLQTLNISQS